MKISDFFETLENAHYIILATQDQNYNLNFFKDFIYLFMRNREGEAETQAEGEAGSVQGAGRGTRSRVSNITPWVKGRR